MSPRDWFLAVLGGLSVLLAVGSAYEAVAIGEASWALSSAVALLAAIWAAK